ncbi:gephyrin-like molybdotransferase Glp [Pleionea sediminis]|uniref:molybdopterin molybdotransferase MoeA n=1 Tax=Pleionea sediminis TaxID=2569479 RepID=UPI0011855954|nr:gephyrin-like molybdotransferase Glp [Pleionea sediminis]
MTSDCCFQKGLMTFAQAKEKLLEHASSITKTSNVLISKALNSTLAEKICSPINVPGFDNSAMDGYAVRLNDVLRDNKAVLVGKSFAGAPYEGDIGQGECVRIMTGAMVPKGADCVIKQEDTSQQGIAKINEMIFFNKIPSTPVNIRAAGDDIKVNQTILEPGRKLTAADIGLLSSLGVREIEIFDSIKIAVFSSGDELIDSNEALEAGKIYDSNRHTTISILKQCGFQVTDLGILPDAPDVISNALNNASKKVDVIITSGGVSVGEADYIKSIVEQLGNISLWKVAMKPGKPFAFGNIGDCHFIGLPGNPVSSMVTLMQLGLPFLRKLQGQLAKDPGYYYARLTRKIQKSRGRYEFQRAYISLNDTFRWEASPIRNQSSGVLSSMSQANGFIVLEPEAECVEVGELVKVQRFNDLLFVES